jgi:transcriptional regulator with XRE-family HTH domain
MNFKERRPPGPDPVDCTVGERVRRRRMQLGLSQGKLAEAIGVTFQQVQKYERGVNRVTASRLCMLAESLQVEPTYFFGTDASPTTAESHQTDALTDLLASDDGTRLAAAFRRIDDVRVRRLLVALVQGLADRDS